MSKEQIEEIDELTTVLYEANHKKSVLDYRWLATEAYNAGYRKQKEGEWVKHSPDPEAMKIFHEMGLGRGMTINSIYWCCSACGNWGTPHHKYCSSCGAKMKGGAE